MSRPLDVFVDRYLEDWPFRSRAAKDMEKFNPSCDVIETKTHYNFKFDLPGVDKNQVKIDLHDNVLTVSGERKSEYKDENKEEKRHVSEVFYGSFYRSFTLPLAVDAERAEATFDDGVLKIAIPKTDAIKPRQITIK